MSFADLPGRPEAGTVLCRVDEIAAGEARNFRFGGGMNLFQIFVVGTGSGIVAYVNQCPHARTPLDWQSEDFFNRSRTLLLCGTHGALFRINDGYCVQGPCAGRSLIPVPIETRDGMIRIGPAPAPVAAALDER